MAVVEHDFIDRASFKKAEAKRLREIRRKRMDAGRQYVTVDLPVDLIELMDRHKAERRLVGRAPIIEDALKEYIAKHGA